MLKQQLNSLRMENMGKRKQVRELEEEIKRKEFVDKQTAI
jgi:cell division protein FtsB